MEAEERNPNSQEPSSTFHSGSKIDSQYKKDASPEAREPSEAPENDQSDQKRKRSPVPEGMTRNAYKKQKKQAEWDAGKAERKAMLKEKDRNKKLARRAARAAGDNIPLTPEEVAKKKKGKSTLVPITFIVDCGFDELMTEAEIKSLASQVTRCYSDNARSTYRAHLAVSSLNGRLKERFDVALEGQYRGWKGVEFHEEGFVEVAEKAKAKMRDEKRGGDVGGSFLKPQTSSEVKPGTEAGEIIYLSSESENTIEKLSPYSTYIIGGLVDRNRHKGICFKTATEKGIKTAKLPIGEFLEMSSRYVLATNHVNEIMLHWLEVGDWGEAFMKVIPKRKGGMLKGESSKGKSVDGGEESEEDKAEDEATTPAGESILQADTV